MEVSITTHQNHTYRVTGVIPDPDGIEYRVGDDPDDIIRDRLKRAVYGGSFTALSSDRKRQLMVPGRDVRQITTTFPPGA